MFTREVYYSWLLLTQVSHLTAVFRGGAYTELIILSTQHTTDGLKNPQKASVAMLVKHKLFGTQNKISDFNRIPKMLNKGHCQFVGCNVESNLS